MPRIWKKVKMSERFANFESLAANRIEYGTAKRRDLAMYVSKTCLDIQIDSWSSELRHLQVAYVSWKSIMDQGFCLDFIGKT